MRAQVAPSFSVSEASIALQLGRDYTPENDVANRLPDLHGISGGGIWRMFAPESAMRLPRWSPSFIRLAGTVHGAQPIKGVTMPHILATIAQAYPELQGAIELARTAADLDSRTRGTLGNASVAADDEIGWTRKKSANRQSRKIGHTWRHLPSRFDGEDRYAVLGERRLCGFGER